MKPSRARRALVALSLVLLTLGAGLAAAAPPAAGAADLAALRVEGTRIVRADTGQAVMLRGVNTMDPLGMRRYIGHFDGGYFAAIRSWGANVVRLPVLPREWHNTFYVGGKPRADRVEVIRQAVTMAADNGMYAIIDWHSIGSLVTGYFQDRSYQTTQAETEEFWTTMARTFRGDPRVAAYELLNEPVTGSSDWPVTKEQWQAQRDWCERMVDVIRAEDPDKPIICGGLDWSYYLRWVLGDDMADPADDIVVRDPDPALRAQNVPAANIIYAVHPYPAKPAPWGYFFGDVAARYAVLATEFGFDRSPGVADLAAYDDDDAATNGCCAPPYSSAMIGYLEGKGIGWMVWNFGPDWAPTLVSDWAYTPTEQGAFYRAELLRLNGEPFPSPTATLPPTPGPSATPTATPVPGTELHVAGLTMGLKYSSTTVSAQATVSIVDEHGAPVEGAQVAGAFSGSTSSTVGGLTDAAGQVTLTSQAKKTGRAWSWTFCVTGVTRAGYSYVPAPGGSCATITTP